MKVLIGLLLISGLLAAGCGRRDPAATSPAADAHPATAPLDYLAAQGRAKQTAIRVTSAAELTGAIQKFHAMEDRYPGDLNELVQHRYLQALPAAPRGQAFQYNPQDGSIRVIPSP
ncbi:MAG: hypothetical protein KF791_06055 [Verrucomicrobiae bacterium]|nr:hypothetical protein [Verrucomicrobiae bacterium]